MKKAIFICVILGKMFGFDFEWVADELVGYTLLDIKTVDNEFNGCDRGKRIIFTDGTYVTCNSYGYSYSYRPKAIIFGISSGGGLHLKMYVNGNLYNIK